MVQMHHSVPVTCQDPQAMRRFRSQHLPPIEFFGDPLVLGDRLAKNLGEQMPA